MFVFDPNPTVSRSEFEADLRRALDEQGTVRDWAWWADVTAALEAVAVSPRPVPESLIAQARAVWRSHRRR
ncbi:hypothetical protein [Sinomonas terrae]|uniref:Uncharacterized protein n=1 Tax=Sinomonas terrae TaxID=2908838 RepID=A0ABS9U792_9MICC|nr:hypothetical protein [Sinomonas terrae]MCH6472578.1 hypothetical protein [Sinomonas terrae]